MAKEKIIVGIDDTAVELKGAELEEFLADRKVRQDAWASEQDAKKKTRETRISAFTKLGLTEEEINAIL